MSEQVSGSYAITSKMPAWMQRILASENIPLEFNVNDLTDRQKATIKAAARLLELEEKGLVKIFNAPDGVYVRSTPKGRAFAKEVNGGR